MEQVFAAQYRSNDRNNYETYAFYVTEDDAEKGIVLARVESTWFDEQDWRVSCQAVRTVSEEEYEAAVAFNTARQFDWSHEYRDDSAFGSIKRRQTCRNCGSSVIQYQDGVIETTGSADQQCPSRS